MSSESSSLLIQALSDDMHRTKDAVVLSNFIGSSAAGPWDILGFNFLAPPPDSAKALTQVIVVTVIDNKPLTTIR